MTLNELKVGVEYMFRDRTRDRRAVVWAKSNGEALIECQDTMAPERFEWVDPSLLREVT